MFANLQHIQTCNAAALHECNIQENVHNVKVSEYSKVIP